jgi:hypothetical protein
VPTAIPFVFAPEDEKQFCTFLAQYELTAYPNRISPDFVSFHVNGQTSAQLEEPAYYFAAEKWGELKTRNIKRGKDRGFFEIDETASPVIHIYRSVYDEEGQLRSGRLWCELNLIGDVQRNEAFNEPFRRMLLNIREHFHLRCHRSDPSGWFIGAQAARLAKAGTILREEGRKGILLRAWK